MDVSVSVDPVLSRIVFMGSSLLSSCDPGGLLRNASAERLWFASSSIDSGTGVSFILTLAFPDGMRLRVNGVSKDGILTLTGLDVYKDGGYKALHFTSAHTIIEGIGPLSGVSSLLLSRISPESLLVGSGNRRESSWSQSLFTYAIVPLLGCISGFKSPSEFGASFGGVSLQFTLSEDGRPFGTFISAFRYVGSARIIVSREASLCGVMPGHVSVDCRRGSLDLSCGCTGSGGSVPSFEDVSDLASLLSSDGSSPSQRKKKVKLHYPRGH